MSEGERRARRAAAVAYRDHEDDADDEALVRGLGVVEEVSVHEAQRHHRRRRGGGQRGGRVRRRGGPPLHPRPFPAPARPRGETLGGAAASGLGGGGAGEDGLGQAGGAEVAMSGAAIEIRAGGGADVSAWRDDDR